MTINTLRSKRLTLSLDQPGTLPVRGKVNIAKFVVALREGKAALEDTSGGGSAITDTAINSAIVTTAYGASMLWRTHYTAERMSLVSPFGTTYA